MKVTAMTEKDALEYFGQRGPEIVRVTRELVSKGETTYIPPEMDVEECRFLKNGYGPNGIAVYLLMKAWKEIPWRANEGKPSPKDNEVTRVADWSEALDPTSSPTWRAALERAGYQTTDDKLLNVWIDGEEVGFEVGEHHAKFLAAASCGELAQYSPEFEPHFFIDMLPWLRQGFWTCGWDDGKNRLKVL